MININNPRNVIVWGFKHPDRLHTHGFVHQGFYRAIKHLYGDRGYWLDDLDDLSQIDFSDSIIITEHEAAKRGLPLNPNSLYVIHGLNNDAALKSLMAHIPHKLGWDVFHDFSMGNTARWNCTNSMEIKDYEDFLKGLKPAPRSDSELDLNRVFINTDFWYYPEQRNMNFRWATDLLKHEIVENKKIAKPWNPDSKVINYVATVWYVNEKELNAFNHACQENGIDFKPVGAGQRGVVSLEDNIRLVQESYFAPAISGSHHLLEGYLPCRIFKNISYGRMGITNSKRVNDLFGGRLIFHPDCHQLFYHAKEQLAKTTIEQVHELMDFVADHHTYINRVQDILKTAKLVMGAE